MKIHQSINQSINQSNKQASKQTDKQVNKTNQFEFLPVQGQTGKRSQVAAKGKRMQYGFFFHIHLKHNFNSVSFVNYYFGLFFLTYNVILY